MIKKKNQIPKENIFEISDLKANLKNEYIYQNFNFVEKAFLVLRRNISEIPLKNLMNETHLNMINDMIIEISKEFSVKTKF